MSTRFSLQGARVIITGASSGLGAEFARQLATRASSIALVARREAPMQALKQELLALNGALDVQLFPVDLADASAREKFWESFRELPFHPNVLINNAGLGDYGAFAQAESDRLYQQIEVNVTALTMMTHEFVKLTQEHHVRYSAVLNVSSLASALPVPDLSVYAATKAYVTSFTEGLAVELKDRGVTLSALCPGPTPTNFGKTAQRVNDIDIDRSGQEHLVIPPDQVVREGLEALESRKVVHFPGARVRFAASLFKLLPKSVLRYILQLRYQRSH